MTPVRVLTIFESGPTAAGTAAGRLLNSVPAGRVTARGIDLSPSPAGGMSGSVCHFPFRHSVDLTCLKNVRRVASDVRPDVVHAFGPLAVRVSAVLRPKRLVVSHTDRAADPFTKWLVRRADAVLSHSAPARDRYEGFGVGRGQTFEFPPACETPDPDARAAVRAELGLLPGTPLLVASGQFDPNAELRFAVWAFDFVRLVRPGMRLVLIGDGPQRPRLERFAASLGCREMVLFMGRRTDAARLIAAADCVWLTHREGGTTVAYEALAAGVPVRGFGTPDALCLPVPADSFVPYGDPAALAVATCRGWEPPDPTGPLRIPPGAMAATVVAVYDSLVTR